MNTDKEITFYTVNKAGRCWNGAHRDRGAVTHIVQCNNPNGSMIKSLCGTEPGRKSYGWSKTDKPTSCSKCIQKLKSINP